MCVLVEDMTYYIGVMRSDTPEDIKQAFATELASKGIEWVDYHEFTARDGSQWIAAVGAVYRVRSTPDGE